MSHNTAPDSGSSATSAITEGTSAERGAAKIANTSRLRSLSSVDTDRARMKRAEWRAGFDAGLKAGSIRYFQSETMVDLAVELTLLRMLFTALCNEVERRGRDLAAINRIKAQALARVVELARELDLRAPGWDRR